MIVVKPNLIIARNMVMTPSNSCLSSENGHIKISVSGNLEVCAAFDKLCKQTTQAFNVDPMTVQEAKKVYDQYYKLWGEFRRKYRHEVFVIVKADGVVVVVEVDNLYLNKKSVNTGILQWSYGVQYVTLTNLNDWNPVEIPSSWSLNTWETVYSLASPLEA